MREAIIQKLKEIEKSYNVKILYACESGSRAWGFPSPDSDYDVRFVYIHKMNWYLSINERKDVIELPIDEVLDIGGWEIRKCLRLFQKSNAPLLEWIQSPIVYMEDELFRKEIIMHIDEYFSPRAVLHHYVSMAKNAFDFPSDTESIKFKKYFYAMRTSLAALWVVKNQSPPPIKFHNLLSLVEDKGMVELIKSLVDLKSSKDERYFHQRDLRIESVIVDAIERSESFSSEFRKKEIDTEILNSIFRKFLNVYG